MLFHFVLCSLNRTVDCRRYRLRFRNKVEKERTHAQQPRRSQKLKDYELARLNTAENKK